MSASNTYMNCSTSCQGRARGRRIFAVNSDGHAQIDRRNAPEPACVCTERTRRSSHSSPRQRGVIFHPWQPDRDGAHPRSVCRERGAWIRGALARRGMRNLRRSASGNGGGTSPHGRRVSRRVGRAATTSCSPIRRTRCRIRLRPSVGCASAASSTRKPSSFTSTARPSTRRRMGASRSCERHDTGPWH